ncbi:MAG: hypothetical protein QG665_327 [Patescibacteria group bacterium]|nr:hypothetical protein [Patescibacteria group bacterium]
MSVKKSSVPINKVAPRPAVHARDDLRRQKLAERKRHKSVRVKVFIIVVVFVLLLGVFAMRHSSLQITEIKVVGTKVTSAEEIKQVVEKKLQGSYFFIFPKNNFLIYPKEEIRRDIMQTSGYIAYADLKVKNFKTLEINISERKAKYIWCGDTASSSDCYFADKTGLIFSAAPGLSKNVMFVIYSPLPVKPEGTKPFSATNFARLDGAVSALPNILNFAGLTDADIDAVRVSNDQDYFFIIQDIAGRGSKEWELRFKAETKLSAISSYLKALWQSAEFQAERSSGALDYVDLRFGKKIYYKFEGLE